MTMTTYCCTTCHCTLSLALVLVVAAYHSLLHLSAVNVASSLSLQNDYEPPPLPRHVRIRYPYHDFLLASFIYLFSSRYCLQVQTRIYKYNFDYSALFYFGCDCKSNQIDLINSFEFLLGSDTR